MLQLWRNTKQTLSNKTCKWLRKPEAVLAYITTMSRRKKEARMLLKLSSFEELKAKVFYKILESGNKQLLKKTPKRKIPEKVLDDAWLVILEQYYNKTDSNAFQSFLEDTNRSNEMELDMVIIEGAYTQFLWGIPEGEETLREMGISGSIKQKISQKRTKYNLYIAKMQSKQKQQSKADYYDLLAEASNRVGYRIPDDVLLVEWIGDLNGIKKDNERKNRETRSSRGRSS